MAILMMLGLIVAAVGAVWLVVVAFQQSVVWGLGTLIVPFVGLAFVAMHWSTAKKPFLVSCAGWLVAGVAALIIG